MKLAEQERGGARRNSEMTEREGRGNETQAGICGTVI